MAKTHSELCIRSTFEENETVRYVVLDRNLTGDDVKPIRTFKTYSGAAQFVEDAHVDAVKERAKSKRARHVFPTNEVPHLWAHKVQTDARNSVNNMFFRGDTIYSYGDHFPIARHVTNKSGRKSAILFTTKDYSVTTSGHKNAVRQAIPHDVTVFDVLNVAEYWGDAYGHASNLKAYVTDSKLALSKAQNCRKYGSSNLKSAFAYKDTAQAYAKFFGVKCLRFEHLPKGKALAELKVKLAQREARAAVADQEAAQRRQARRAEEQRIYDLALPEKIALWRTGKDVRFGWNNDVPTLLRLSKDNSEVETSKGARVPVKDARRAVLFVQYIMARGTEWKRNGENFRLGVYQLDKVEVNGTVTAGCHVIPYSEIELLSPTLDALVATLTILNAATVL